MHVLDQVKTGKKLKTMLQASEYDVKYVQEYLNLSCPQSIYRWFRGERLPSLEHLYALSRLLDVHMENLLVAEETEENPMLKRVLMYAKYFQKVA